MESLTLRKLEEETEEETKALEDEATKKRDVHRNTCGASRDAQRETGSEERVAHDRVDRLRRDFLTLVSDIQAAADANESSRRSKFEEACRRREQRLHQDVTSGQEKYEEISRGWTRAAEKTFHLDLREALSGQRRLCASLAEDKRRLINDLKEELKSEDDRFVKDLRKQSEDLDLMLEKIRDQFQALTDAYREELAQAKKTYEEEHEILLREDQSRWQQHLEELLEQQLRRAKEKRGMVEECEEKLHLQMSTTDEYSRTDVRRKYLDLEKEVQQLQADKMISDVRRIRMKDDTEIKSLVDEKNKVMSLSEQRKSLQRESEVKEKLLLKNRRALAEEYERHLLEQENLKRKMRHFASSDDRKYSEMNRMLQAETDLLVEKLSFIDSVISQHPLGPSHDTPLTDGRSRTPETRTVLAPRDSSADLRADRDVGTDEELVMKLEELLKEEEDQDLCDQDFLLLTHFLSEYKQDLHADSAQSSSELLHPHHVLPALKIFLKTHRGRRSQGRSQSNLHLCDEVRMIDRLMLSSAPRHPSSSSSEENYWKKMSNIVSEDKMKLWAAAEETLKVQHRVLKEISDLIPETESLKQQNSELRALLQQTLVPTVDAESS